jgi:pyruvate/2-oxoglutarate dehydrogenase complex dihydrolipoamide dehydrogenase (E3) component
MAQKYDAIIIGTGQSGPSLAARLSNEGMKVAVAERHLFGGTCVNVGCIPTKTLVASARAAYMARRGADFGVMIDGNITVDMKKVKARKDALVQASNQGVENWMKSMDNTTVYEGHARFEGPHTVRVGEDVLESDKIFINVGARSSAPPIPGLDDVDYMTNSQIMEVDFLPEHLLVLGGSYIGLEFGQMYRRFGSEVTVVQRDEHLVSREDEDVSEAVREIVENEGVTVCTDTGDQKIEQRGDRIAIQMMCGGASREVVGSHLLVATGRRPNTDDLGLDKAGIEADNRGNIQVDDELRTNVPGVWAIGDCNGKGAFTHTSYNDFEIVAANLIDGDPRRVSDRIMTYALYIDPPLARVGMTERQVRELGRKALVAKKPMSHIGRAKEKSETQGFMKFLVDAETKEFLGATILGVGGDEIIHCVLDVMYAKAPYTTIQRAVHIHPTVAELIPTTLQELKPLE